MGGGLVRSVALTGSDQAVRATASVYRGICVRNSHASNASTVDVYDHASAASGTLIGSFSLAAGEEADVLHPAGIWCENGIYVDVGGTGTVIGSIRVG